MANIEGIVQNFGQYGFTMDSMSLGDGGVVTFAAHFTDQYGHVGYETTGTFDLYGDTNLHVTTSTDPDHSYATFEKYLKDNNMAEPRVFDLYNRLEANFRIVPVGSDTGELGTISGAWVKEVPVTDEHGNPITDEYGSLGSCFEVHYPVEKRTDKIGYMNNYADLPVIIDLSDPNEVRVYCAKYEGEVATRGALLGSGVDVVQALQNIKHFSDVIASYRIDTLSGFKITNVLTPGGVKPGITILADDGTAIVYFSCDRGSGSASSTNLYKSTFDIESGSIKSLAIVDRSSDHNVVKFDGVPADNVPVEYLKQAADDFKLMKSWKTGQINSFDMTDTGISASFWGTQKKGKWVVPGWRMDVDFENGKVYVSPNRGMDAGSATTDTGSIENVLQFALMMTSNPETGYVPSKEASTAWIKPISDSTPVFYRDTSDNLCFRADCSNIRLASDLNGFFYARQDATTGAWTITDRYGDPVPKYDAHGNLVEYPSLSAYMEINGIVSDRWGHPKSPKSWVIDGIDIGYAVDPVTSFGIDRMQLIVDGELRTVIYNHGTGMFSESGHASRSTIKGAIDAAIAATV